MSKRTYEIKLVIDESNPTTYELEMDIAEVDDDGNELNSISHSSAMPYNLFDDADDREIYNAHVVDNAGYLIKEALSVLLK